MIDTRARSTTRQVARWGILVATLGMTALTSIVPQTLTAQATRGQSVVVQSEPKYTRIFGSDTMSIGYSALSPDGRWIVFSRSLGSNTSNLWVISARGGSPTQLTSGLHRDDLPAWFPSGDRIAFISDRPSPPGAMQTYVMSIPFDAQTGRTAGAAQQVSLEAAFYAAVSPDGRSIVFETPELPGKRRLMVVPSAGGTARTVVRTAGLMHIPQWSPDGREIYFADKAPGATERTLMRVSADGGEARRVWSTPRRIWSMNTATRRALTLDLSTSGFEVAKVAEVSTFDGRPVGTVSLHKNMMPSSITGDGQTVIAVVSDVVTSIRVVPVAGGPSRSLTQAREYDDLDSWSTDATRLSVVTRTNGHSTLLDLPVDGSPGVAVATPPGSSGEMLSPDRKHLFYVVSDPVTGRKNLWVRRLSDGRTREIARDLVSPGLFSIDGPGGSRFSGDELLFFGRRGDRFELRACAPEGEPRVLRSFPLDLSAVGINSGAGVHGERVAWTEVFGDSSALLVAEGRTGTPRRVAVVQGTLRFPVWSPDGRWIAVNSHGRGGSSRYAVLLVGVAPGGQPSAPPRFIDAGGGGWDIRWLPDSRALTLLGSVGGGANDIWLVSLRDGDRPVNLTRDDPSNMVIYSVSPDGKYIAYPAEIPRGSSIWRIDLRR